MYKILGYDADGFGWTFVSRHSGHRDAILAGASVRAERLFQWVAVVQVYVLVRDGANEIAIVECNAPNVAGLLGVAEFRAAALRNH